MRNLTYLALCATALLFMGACQNDRHAKNYNNSNVDPAGVMFIRGGIVGGMTEIKASGEALTKSNNQRVIALAKMMIDDHTKAGEELKKIESDKLVTGTDSIRGEDKLRIDSLSQKSVKAFDRTYLKMMVADHAAAVKLFTDATHNPDSEISKFATATLPAIKMHLDSATAILSSIK